MSEQPAGPLRQQPSIYQPWRTIFPPDWFVQRLNGQRPVGKMLRATDPLAMSLWHMVSMSPPLTRPVVSLISGC